MASSSLPLSEADGGPITTRSSLWAYLKEGIEDNPDGFALIAQHQTQARLYELLGSTSASEQDSEQASASASAANAPLTCTYKQILDGCLRLASGLIKQGVKPGDTVVALIPSGVEWIFLFWTSALMKLTLSMLDPGLLSPDRKDQLTAYLNITQPEVVVVESQENAAMVEQASLLSIYHNTQPMSMPIGILLSGTGTSTSSNGFSWSSLTEIMEIGGHRQNPLHQDGALLEDALHDDPTRIAWIFFTSGTSASLPKACPRTIESIAHFTANTPKQPSRTPQGRTIHWSISTGNYRIAASTALFGMFRAGWTIVLSGPSFDAGAVMKAIETWRIEFAMLIPSNIYQIIKHPDFSPGRLTSLIGIGIGGDVLTRTHFNIAKSAFPALSLFIVVYAMTEGSGWVSSPFPPNMAIDQIPWLDDICPAGRVQSGTRVRIWNPETKQILPQGETGELLVHSKSIMPYYLGGSGGNDKSLDLEVASFYIDDQNIRWFRTGDQAIMNQTGLIYIIGRLSSIFKRASVPINPLALERNIASFLANGGGIYNEQMVCVVPVPLQTLGHVPFAVISSFAGKSKQEIVDNNLQVFGDAYALADVVELKGLGIDAWPINAAGKLLRVDVLGAVMKSGYASGVI